MTVVAILIAAGVVALIYAGLFFLVWGALIAMFAFETRGAAQGQPAGMDSIQGTGKSSFGLAFRAD